MRCQTQLVSAPCRPPLVDPSQDFLSPPDRIADRTDGCRNPRAAVPAAHWRLLRAKALGDGSWIEPYASADAK
jgi:hypothetical protein